MRPKGLELLPQMLCSQVACREVLFLPNRDKHKVKSVLLGMGVRRTQIIKCKTGIATWINCHGLRGAQEIKGFFGTVLPRKEFVVI